MGGFIATLFAARYPERVDRLVISGAIAKCDQMARSQFEVWKAIARAYGTDSDELAVELCTKALSRPFLDESFGAGRAAGDPRGRRPQRERRRLLRRL